jgi:DNA repair protein RecN (Recombination protein N)
VPSDHPSIHALAVHGLDIASAEGGVCEVILRRVQGSDGRSRAFINDEPVGITLLKAIGDCLVEVHGQHDERGLLNPASHRALLDLYGGLAAPLTKVKTLFSDWREAQAELERVRGSIAEARAQADYYAHVLEELMALDPQEDEEDQLAARRTFMMHAEQISNDLTNALRELTGSRGVLAGLPKALRRLEKSREKAGGSLDPAIAALDRVLNEAAEAGDQLNRALEAVQFDPMELEQSEERLFALRAAARKHNVRPGELTGLITTFQSRLDEAQAGEARLDELETEVEKAREAYWVAAESLSTAREKAAAKIDKAVGKELGPLKLEKATFKTLVSRLDEERIGEGGLDKVEFLVSTNPGSPLGPMVAIASGGELARFILALKVCLAAEGSAASLIFDEVDQGVGGAVADAVGERLARLASGGQVLVVTHSPQVAARGNCHWHIEKGGTAKSGEKDLVTRVTGLDGPGRREEIARMLAGAEVTEEARAAADQLIAGNRLAEGNA